MSGRLTRKQEGVFLMSETERAFSQANAADYELHVVYGINLDGDSHEGHVVVPGAVTAATHGLTVQRWQGRVV